MSNELGHMIHFGYRLRQDRRKLVFGALAGLIGTPRVCAQTQRKLPHIGWLTAAGSETAALQYIEPTFLAGMREQGYELGQQYILDIRVYGGDARRIPALADELIALRPDVLIGVQTAGAVMAAKTSTIPIVLLTSFDPVGAGLVKSLARPETNVTGMAGLSDELIAKQVELLLDLVPKASRIAMLTTPFWARPDNYMRSLQQAADAKRADLVIVSVKDAGEVKQAFDEFESQHVQGLIVDLTGLTLSLTQPIREGIVRLRLPAIAPIGFPQFGAALSYGVSADANFHEAADIVVRILKGAKPADLPVRQPARIELVINRKNVREIGLTVPQSILLRADKVVD